MQRKTPRFHDAQRGCLLRLQSAQLLLGSSLTSCLRVARFCSLRSGAAAPGLRDIFDCGCVSSNRLVDPLVRRAAMDQICSNREEEKCMCRSLGFGYCKLPDDGVEKSVVLPDSALRCGAWYVHEGVALCARLLHSTHINSERKR